MDSWCCKQYSASYILCLSLYKLAVKAIQEELVKTAGRWVQFSVFHGVASPVLESFPPRMVYARTTERALRGPGRTFGSSSPRHSTPASNELSAQLHTHLSFELCRMRALGHSTRKLFWSPTGVGTQKKGFFSIKKFCRDANT